MGQIQASTDIASWNHVKTQENPADIISRGIPPSQLLQSQLWWNGPPWLSLDRKHWSSDTVAMPTADFPEARRSVSITTNAAREWNIFHDISSIQRLLRTTAYVLRFINNAGSPRKDHNTGSLTAAELNHARLRFSKIVQEHVFSVELKALKDHKAIPRSSKLLGLAPFTDQDGIIRVGGRLSFLAPVFGQASNRVTFEASVHENVNHPRT